MNRIVEACKRLRLALVESEYQIHDALVEQFNESGIDFQKEYKLGPRKRIDFLCEGGVGIEVKKGKPNSRILAEQARKYLDCDEVKGLILLIERSVFQHDREYNGKPIIYISLSKLWGIG